MKEFDDTFNDTYYISNKICVRQRIDKKIELIDENNELIVLDNISSKLMLSYNGGNKLLDIVKGESIDAIRYHKVFESFHELLLLNYLVKEYNEAVSLSPTWILEEVFLELSKQCNLRCHHCYIPKNIRENEMKYEDWLRIVNDCKKLGVHLIKLTGGEPMLNHYFFDLVQYIHLNKIKMRLYTNGSYLNEDNILKLHEYGIDEIQISVDGGKATTHDEFRRTSGNYAKIEEALPLLAKSKIKVILSFTVSNFNEGEIDQFIHNARTYDNVKVVVSPYINYHQTFQCKDMLNVNDRIIDKIRSCFEENKILWSDKTKYFLTFSNKYIGYCGLGLYSIYIDATGKILLCPLLNQDENIIGSLKEESLIKIWEKSKKLMEYRSHTLSDIGECNTCNHVNECRAGCRARAYFTNNILLSKDPISCKMFV